MRKLKNLFNNKAAAVAAAAAAAATVSAPAFAAGGGGVDVGDVVTAIQGAAGPIAAIGGAVLTVMVGIKVYKWVRRAM
ncbi:hypothetical protein MOU_17827 [Xanthomonas citri pv. malvacearum str. GSPB1386]|uniref:major capsid protein n=1 Tax=Xanthomonas TaxID=338 RepID=UPI0002982050|nr:major capsid protein [Xanthomonas citri]ASY88963.1 methyltransferase [Xanthomonas citri pv. malvacearum]EKQ61382.1 hypothetical protein MOU_17827 [Xanthomonas citri pv. malvacearum str. GSPB1386]